MHELSGPFLYLEGEKKGKLRMTDQTAHMRSLVGHTQFALGMRNCHMDEDGFYQDVTQDNTIEAYQILKKKEIYALSQ